MKKAALALLFAVAAFGQTQRPVVLHAARILDIETGKIISPGEILVNGERIVQVGASVPHPARKMAKDRTLSENFSGILHLWGAPTPESSSRKDGALPASLAHEQ